MRVVQDTTRQVKQVVQDTTELVINDFGSLYVVLDTSYGLGLEQATNGAVSLICAG